MTNLWLPCVIFDRLAQMEEEVSRVKAESRERELLLYQEVRTSCDSAVHQQYSLTHTSSTGPAVQGHEVHLTEFTPAVLQQFMVAVHLRTCSVAPVRLEVPFVLCCDLSCLMCSGGTCEQLPSWQRALFASLLLC